MTNEQLEKIVKTGIQSTLTVQEFHAYIAGVLNTLDILLLKKEYNRIYNWLNERNILDGKIIVGSAENSYRIV